MIAALAYTLMFLTSGVMCVRFLLPRHRPLNRLWLGLSFGLLEEMWMPALSAYFLSFSEAGHVAAVGLMVLVTGICFLCRDRRCARGWDEEETLLLKQILWVALPLTIISAYLQVTHSMRVDARGNWHVGQSTYGDLPMHMSFITGIIGKRFPADYPFYPGARLSYPFLTDALSSTFVLLGSSLQAALVIPGTLMMGLCYAGVLILGREMTGGKKTVVLAALLFFMNGGLGFLYDFDLAGGTTESVSGYFSTVGERLETILTGYYKTPTNQPDPNNLRWSNVICDLMIPQRTLLGGWCMVFPCFYLLDAVFRARKRDEGNGLRGLLLLGVWAGALPMIHTHSFLALGLGSLGLMVYDITHGDPWALPVRRTRWQIAWHYLLYGVTAAAIAAPQLVFYTFTQVFQGAAQGFVQLHFNWVNNAGGEMRDLYIWFYVKNIGLPFLILILALIERTPRHRRLFAMAFPIILAAEFIRFQPNDYDNNKLLYLAWLPCCMIIADWCADLWRKLKGLRARPVIAGIVAAAIFLSAGLTVWRECVSDYVAFGRQSVEAGEYVRDHTERDAVFITGTQHLNPIASLAGRSIVCGPDLYLYWHGFDTRERQAELKNFYEHPEKNKGLAEKYGADYIYVSSYERSKYKVDEDALDRLYLKVFENDEATVYRIQ